MSNARRRLAHQLDQLAVLQGSRGRAEGVYAASAFGKTQAVQIIHAQNYLTAAKQRVNNQETTIEEVEKQVELARVDLLEETKRKRILDRLRERQLTEHDKLAQREKQKQIDEAANKIYFRRRQDRSDTW